MDNIEDKLRMIICVRTCPTSIHHGCKTDCPRINEAITAILALMKPKGITVEEFDKIYMDLWLAYGHTNKHDVVERLNAYFGAGEGK